MRQVFEDLAGRWSEERALEKKKTFARQLITRGKQMIEKITEEFISFMIIRARASFPVYCLASNHE